MFSGDGREGVSQPVASQPAPGKAAGGKWREPGEAGAGAGQGPGVTLNPLAKIPHRQKLVTQDLKC